MEEGQGTTSQTKGINNSIRGAALCVGLKPDTVLRFLPLMRSFEMKDMSGLNYAELSEENHVLNQQIKALDVEREFLLQRIDELSKVVRDQHDEAVKLKADVAKAQGKVA